MILGFPDWAPATYPTLLGALADSSPPFAPEKKKAQAGKGCRHAGRASLPSELLMRGSNPSLRRVDLRVREPCVVRYYFQRLALYHLCNRTSRRSVVDSLRYLPAPIGRFRHYTESATSVYSSIAQDRRKELNPFICVL